MVGMSEELEIRVLGDDQVDAWDSFVEQNRDATFFHRAGWRTVLEKGLGHKAHYLYVVDKSDRIQGIFPLGEVRSFLFGHSLISVPFCVYGGIAAQSDAAYDKLLNAATELATRLNVDYLEVRNPRPLGDPWKTKQLYVNFSKEIDPDPEQNMLAIPRKQRAMVRKGIKAGLESSLDDGVDRLHEAYSESVRNLGTPVFPKSYFQILKDVFGDACEVLTICKDEELVGSVMSFYFRDQVLPYYGGGTFKARSLKGNDFMYWELMRRGSEKGVRVFDYGRSKRDTGSYSFKKNWGFEPAPLDYQYFLVRASEVPDINPTNPKYQLIIRIWKKLPLSLTRIIGPFIAKNLG